LSRTSGKSRYEDIESGLRALVQEVRQRQIRSIAIPPSGSGLGGLQWGRVKGMIEAAFEDIPDVRVKLYELKASPGMGRIYRRGSLNRINTGGQRRTEIMSEYQYYEFLAIDRPLTKDEMADLRGISSRAYITPVSFTNEYPWGDLKANPEDLMKRFFDAHVYVANWMTAIFILNGQDVI
jgi:hypothetical protein